MYIKYDLALKRLTGRERSQITEISSKEYAKYRNIDTLFKFVDYDTYENAYKENVKCSTDIFFDFGAKYIFIEGDRTKMQDRHILITNEYVSTSNTYYNECKFTPRRLEYSLPSSRESSELPIFYLKLVIGLILDFLTWPFQFFVGALSPGW